MFPRDLPPIGALCCTTMFSDVSDFVWASTPRGTLVLEPHPSCSSRLNHTDCAQMVCQHGGDVSSVPVRDPPPLDLC